MNMAQIKTLVAAAALGSFAILGGAAGASTYNSLQTCSVSDISPNAASCFGAIAENENDSSSVLNTGTFIDGSVTNAGLFGHQDWSFVAKKDIGGGLSGADIGLSVTGGATSGSWSVTNGALAAYSRLVVILKASNTFAAYLFEPGSSLGSTGSWKTDAVTNKNGKVQGLSHFSIYASGGQIDNTPPPSMVPVPAGLPLLLSALGLAGLLRRRSRKSA